MKKELLALAMKKDVLAVEHTISADLEALRKEIDPLLYEILQYGLLDGGKRIRPVLTVVSARLCGTVDADIYNLAIAFEYLHAATLFHDDVLDNAEKRRGRPAVRRKFGDSAAILAGDFLHARSMNIIAAMTGRKGLAIFCEATAGMVDGEFRQLRNMLNVELSEEDYFQIISRKTGNLISAACQLGAVYAHASEQQQLALKEYGTSLGYAFQIIDDLLDLQGDAGKTGKNIGNDFIEGKITLPCILSYNIASIADKLEFQKIFLEPYRQRLLPDFIALVNAYNGFTAARQKAIELTEKAMSSLEIFDAPNDTSSAVDRDLLKMLADYVISREK